MWIRRTIAVLLIVLPVAALIPFPGTPVSIKVDLPPGTTDATAKTVMSTVVTGSEILAYLLLAASVLAGVFILWRSFRPGRPPDDRPA